MYPHIQYYELIALTLVSNTVLHSFETPIRNARSPPCRLHSLSAIRNNLSDLSTEECPILAVRRSYIALISFPEPTTLFQATLDTPTMFCPVFILEGSGSPDVTAFACRHTTRRSCSPLQYCLRFWLSFLRGLAKVLEALMFLLTGNVTVWHIQGASVNCAILQHFFFLVRQQWGGSRYRHFAANFKAL
jgi:hypothetical protein